MSKSVPKTDIYGQVIGYEYYDDSNHYVGESRIMKRAFGNDYLENYDEKGNLIGTSEYNNGSVFRADPYLENYDKDGRRIGETRIETGIMSSTKEENSYDNYVV